MIRILEGDCRTVMATMDGASIDSVVTDPPYHLTAGKKGGSGPASVSLDSAAGRARIGTGFMGMKWDGGDVAFQPATWAECLRILKPGGYLLAFSGSRTYHRMACAIEDAGFEIRDQLMWLYGSGFPKSKDATQAMADFIENGPSRLDRVHPVNALVLQVTAFVRAARDRAGWTNKRIDELFGTNGMSGHWTTGASQPACPSKRQWGVLKERLGFDDSMDEIVEQIHAVEREERERDTDTQKRFLDELHKGNEWGEAHGWGTALKPAHEPIVMARKPFSGSVAANVLQFGTGALNIAGCRIETDGETFDVPQSDPANRQGVVGDAWQAPSDAARNQAAQAASISRTALLGRWPANIMHDGSDEAVAGFPEGGAARPGRVGPRGGSPLFGSPTIGSPEKIGTWPADSGGSAARYFYTAKTSRYDRHDGTHDLPERAGAEWPQSLDGDDRRGAAPGGNHHPTVKPTELMRWLVRLVTPPGGVVLDPFMGSGSTLKAAELEQFSAIGIELDPAYIAIARRRIASDAPLFAPAIE